MIKVNGATLDWEAYEFGVRLPSGECVVFPSYHQAKLSADAHHYPLVMRVRYHTGWEPAL